MEKDFDYLVEVLENASERTRRSLYVFLLFNLSLFVFVFGVDVLIRPSERVREFREAIFCSSNHMQDGDIPNGFTLNCGDLKDMMVYRGYNLRVMYPEISSNTTMNEIDVDLLKKKLDSLSSAEVDSNSIQIPIVGIKIDVDYLWIASSVVGLLGLVVITASLKTEIFGADRAARLLRQFREEQEIIDGKCFRVLSVQVLTWQKNDDLDKKIGLALSKCVFYIHEIIIYFIVLLPLFTISIIMYYDLAVIDLFTTAPSPQIDSFNYRWKYFLSDLSSEFGRHFIFNLAEFIIDPTTFVAELALTIYFVKQSIILRNSYREISEI